MNAARTWWASGALGALVLASSLLVPRLVAEQQDPPAPASADGGPVATATATVEPAARSSEPALPAGGPSADSSAATPTSPAPSTRPVKPKATKTARPAFRPIRVAAAAPTNKLVDVAKIDCPTCASGSRVQYVGQGHAVVLRLRDVPVGGRRTLVIVYESENTRPLDVVLADGTTKSLKLPGRGNWITPARFEVSVDVPAGDSEMTFFHATDPAPDLDQFIIQ